MPKLKSDTIWLSVEEDAAITAAALSDPDSLPYTDSQWQAAKPTIRRGRPLVGEPKMAISLRLPSSTLARWKASGPGWQTRMAEYLASAPIAKQS